MLIKKYIIKNDKLFLKIINFQELEYEKFLIKSGITAPIFEQNIVRARKKKTITKFLSGGIIIPENLIQKEFNKENQIKTIQFDLNVFYNAQKKMKKILKDLYEKNKKIFFIENFKEIICCKT